MTFWSAPSARALRGAVIFAVLCPAALVAQRQNGLLVGRVLSGDVAVPGAIINASGGRVTIARVDGRFRMSLPAGRYTVRAQRIGFTSASDTVTITTGVTSTVNFRVERAVAALEAVASLGTRGAERSAIDVPVPVDVIDGAQLRSTGRTTTSEALQAFSPSIGVSHAGAGQASDLVHPFSMRGLGPDHVLVLVNGKRRHSSALVNTNRSLGRGSSGVDLDAIPLSVIDRIEILHGDAVAQYGSDAIAGVVNVVLKSGVHGFAATTAGERMSTYNRDADTQSGSSPATVSARDGRTFQAAIDKGVVFGERGFLHGGFEVRDQGTTNRAVADTRVIAPAGIQFGDPHSHDVSLVLNGGNLFANGLEVYANGVGSRRSVSQTGDYFFGIFAMPAIRGTLTDYSGTAGVRGQADEWRWDLSTVYGRNAVGLKYAAGATTTDAGEQRLAEWTTNLDLNREFSYFEETRVAVGAEIRRDAYDQGSAGSPPVPIAGQPVTFANQSSARSRSSVGGHVDVEADLSSSFTLGLAGRVERYDRIGTQKAGKLSARFEPKRKLVFRGSVARGFRAPSLQQASLATGYFDPLNQGFVQVVPTQTYAASGAGSRPELQPERSTTYQAGVATEVSSGLSFTLDAYRTDLSERILIDEGSNLFVLTPGGITYEVHTFANGTKTRTDGLDATVNYGVQFQDSARLRFTVGANLNHTTLVGATGTASTATGIEQTRITRGEPRSNLLASALFGKGAFSALARVQRFGEVTGSQVNLGVVALPALGGFTFGNVITDQTFAPRWVSDVRASFTLLRKYTFSVGADNLFDVYPERRVVGNDALGTPLRGVSPYTTDSPFGFNGRFVYGRLSIYL